MSLAINHPSCKFAPGHFAKLGGMSQKSPGFSMSPQLMDVSTLKNICLYTWLWMMQCSGLARDTWKLQNEQSWKRKIKAGGREKVSNHPSFGLLTFCWTKNIDSWFLEKLRRSFVDDWECLYDLCQLCFELRFASIHLDHFLWKKQWDFWIAR